MSKKIKIIHVISELNYGGAERLLLDLGRKIDKSKFDFQVVTIGRGGKLVRDFNVAEIKVTVISKHFKGDWTVVRRLKQFFKQEKPDIVHLHLFGGEFWGGWAAKLAKVPVIIGTKHDVLPDPFIKKILLGQVRKFYSRIVAISNASRDFLVKFNKYPGEKITVIYNGIDMSKFSKEAPPILRHDKVTFCSVGRLVPLKNHRTLVRACKYLKRDDWQLYLVGDGSERSKLQEMVTQQKMEEKILFTGFIPDIREYLEKSDVFVLASRSEGMGLSVIEAAALGKFVVASRVGGVPEIITDGVNGRMFEPNDLESLVNIMNWIFTHRDEAQKMAVKLQSRVHEKFDINLLIKEYENLYQWLVK